MTLYKYNNNTISFKKISILKYIILLVIFNIVSIVLLNSTINKENKEIIYSEEYIPVKLSVDSFSMSKLKTMLESLNIKHSDIVLAQSILETGNFQSKIFKENNNLFGMKVAKTRANTALGIQNNHAYYKSWRESVYDYALWQNAFCRKLSREEYLIYLDSIYAEDNEYKLKLLQIINKNYE